MPNATEVAQEAVQQAIWTAPFILRIVEIIVLAVTAGIVCWYTIVTTALKKATEKQTEQMIQPLIVLDYKYDSALKAKIDQQTIKVTPIPELTLINATENPALNIYIEDIYLDNGDRIKFDYFPIVYGKESHTLNPVLYIDDNPETVIGYPIQRGKNNFRNPVTVCLIFTDIKMNKFELTGKLSNNRFKVQDFKQLQEK